MKRMLSLIILLALAACAAPPPTVVPLETIVAQTWAAMQASFTATPVPPTAAPANNQAPATEKPQGSQATATAGLPQNAPGASCVPTDRERVRARVTRVLSGDTLEVAIGNEVHNVRYLGIKAPQLLPRPEWQAAEAMAENQRLAGSQIVTLVKGSPESDANGNWLRYVFTNDAFLNYELIKIGLAKVDADNPSDTCQSAFQEAEAGARTAVAGVWAPTPMPTRTLKPSETPLPPGVTLTSTPVPPCNCGGPLLSCNSFRTQAEAQACYNYCKSLGFGDVFGLDKNHNNLACEGTK